MRRITGLHVTSLKLYLRSKAFYKTDTCIFSRISCIKPSCKILGRYEASIRSYKVTFKFLDNNGRV